MTTHEDYIVVLSGTTIRIFRETSFTQPITEISVVKWPLYTEEEYIQICRDMHKITDNFYYIHLQLIKNVNLRSIRLRNLERQMAVIIWIAMTDVDYGELSCE
jgi:hypothetical protein